MTGPRIDRVHVDFWQAKKATPRFASLVGAGLSVTLRKSIQSENARRKPSALIDACVNAHAGLKWDTRSIDATNTLAVIRLATKRQPLRNYLRKLCDSQQSGRRKHDCRKWLARIERDNPEVLPPRYFPFGNPCAPN